MNAQPRVRENKWYGWRPDLPDKRDHVLAVEKPAAHLPLHVDLSSLPEMPPVYDQGDLGSCTANAIAACLQFDRRKQKLADYVPSRLMLYYEERRIEGSIMEDAGAEIRDGMKVAARLGVCDEKLWPYNIGNFREQPPPRCYAPALEDQALKYARVTQNVSNIKRVLATGFPIVFGFTVYESFEDNVVERTGIVPMPGPNEASVGGHAVCLVGYDEHHHFIVRNSWGADWGMKGYCLMPTRYVADNNLADDFWVVRRVG